MHLVQLVQLDSQVILAQLESVDSLESWVLLEIQERREILEALD